MPEHPPGLEGFEPFAFSHGDSTRSVYRHGKGPGVVVVHEIPGITPEVLTKDLVDEAGHPTREALDRVLALFHQRLRAA